MPRDFRSNAARVAASLLLGASSAHAQTPPGDDADVEVRARPATTAGGTSSPAPAQPHVDAPPRAEGTGERPLPASNPSSAPAATRGATPMPAPARAEPARPPAGTETDTSAGLGAVRTTSARPDAYSLLEPVGLVLSGFAQVQHEWSELSQDQLAQGVPLNRDRFVLRRARLRLDGSWPWFAFVFELDANTVRGGSVGPRRVEASWVWRNPANGGVPWLAVTAGLTEAPFGMELGEGVRRRWFAERSAGSLAFFPGEPDVGVRAWGGAGPLRYALGIFNGTPLDDRAGLSGWRSIDPTARHDLSGRVGIDTQTPSRAWSVLAGVSFLAGTGFHPGDEGTKPGIEWRDNNQNSMIDAGELVAIPGRAPTPSTTFARWALNADVALRVRTRPGLGRLFAEATLGSNLDRGAFASDPVATGYALRQTHAVVGFTQEVTPYGLLGFRWDYYNPNVDLFEERRGEITPRDQGVHTLSPLVALAWPGRARLVFQYDLVLDALGRDARGIPIDLPNNQTTLRLQGDF